MLIQHIQVMSYFHTWIIFHTYSSWFHPSAVLCSSVVGQFFSPLATVSSIDRLTFLQLWTVVPLRELSFVRSEPYDASSPVPKGKWKRKQLRILVCFDTWLVLLLNEKLLLLLPNEIILYLIRKRNSRFITVNARWNNNEFSKLICVCPT